MTDEATPDLGKLQKELTVLDNAARAAKERLVRALKHELAKLPEIKGVTRLSPNCMIVSSNHLFGGDGKRVYSKWDPNTYDAPGQYAAIAEAIEDVPWPEAIQILRRIVDSGCSRKVKLAVGRRKLEWFHSEVQEQIRLLLDRLNHEVHHGQEESLVPCGAVSADQVEHGGGQSEVR